MGMVGAEKAELLVEVYICKKGKNETAAWCGCRVVCNVGEK